ncbi:MAG: N-acetylglucosamine kinase [Anaerolineae bacterium]
MRLLGIDGGGSNLRVVITDEHLNELVRVMRGAANPNTAGREQAAVLIQDAIREALAQAQLESIDAVGIGIAGASVAHAKAWLRETVSTILPDSIIAPASDNEIALVGGTGERYGLLLLAGTGSVGFGIGRNGETLQVGGWGYLLGDEGSGYWMGVQALKNLTHYRDQGLPYSPFAQRIADHIASQGALHLIDWVYVQTDNPVRTVATLAPIVLQSAEAGDNEALAIINQGVDALVQIKTVLIERLALQHPPIIFAGGLLANETILSKRLMVQLGMERLPQPRHEPVIGAALLAKLALTDHTQSG